MTPLSSKSFKHRRATDPLIFILSTRTATVMRRYDWTSLLSLSEVALSRRTACWALSLTFPLDLQQPSVCAQFVPTSSCSLPGRPAAISTRSLLTKRAVATYHFFFAFPPAAAILIYVEVAGRVYGVVVKYRRSRCQDWSAIEAPPHNRAKLEFSHKPYSLIASRESSSPRHKAQRGQFDRYAKHSEGRSR